MEHTLTPLWLENTRRWFTLTEEPLLKCTACHRTQPYANRHYQKCTCGAYLYDNR